MLPIADFGLGEALLTALSIFFFVIWIWILITILTDLFRDHEVSGWGKAAWVFFLVFVPFLTALIYLGVRGSGMRERAIKAQEDARSQWTPTSATPRRPRRPTSSTSSELKERARSRTTSTRR